MYAPLLLLHSWLRWLVILVGIWAVASAWSGVPARSRRPGRAFTIAVDLQMLIGVVLYVAFSPITRAALTDMAGAMRNPAWRFWTVEHPALMMLAVAFAHIGLTLARKREATSDGTRSRGPFWWHLAALLALLAAIPWPARSYGRPLLRLAMSLLG